MLRSVERALTVVVAAGVVLIVLLVSLQVIYRYAVRQPLVWSEELTTLSYQWLSFLGAALAVRHRAHFGVDFLVRRLGPAWASGLAWLGHAVVWAMGIFMIVYGLRIVESSALQMYPTLPFSVGTGYSVVPISGVLFLLMDCMVFADRRAGRLRDVSHH
jgi:TRAP-type C4-dicarboxylate transport system permease small subunit